MELSELTDKAIDYIIDWLKDFPDGNGKLTTWEKQFIESVSDQWARRRQMTEKQKEILDKIWDKV